VAGQAPVTRTGRGAGGGVAPHPLPLSSPLHGGAPARGAGVAPTPAGQRRRPGGRAGGGGGTSPALFLSSPLRGGPAALGAGAAPERRRCGDRCRRGRAPARHRARRRARAASAGGGSSSTRCCCCCSVGEETH